MEQVKGKKFQYY